VATRPRSDAPADLREDIMRQVRTLAEHAAPGRRAGWLRKIRWVLIPAAVASVALALIVNRQRPADSSSPEVASLRTASLALGLNEKVAEQYTAGMVEPLQEEMRLLDGDIRRTAEYLLASVP